MPTQPTPTTTLTLADCPRCGATFGVDTEALGAGAGVRCPDCESRIEVATLVRRPLRVASAIAATALPVAASGEKRVAPTAAPTPAQKPPAATSEPATLADWLRGSETAATAEPVRPNFAEALKSAPQAAQAGVAALGSVAAKVAPAGIGSAPGAAPRGEPTPATKPTATPTSAAPPKAAPPVADFRFDFGSSSLEVADDARSKAPNGPSAPSIDLSSALRQTSGPAEPKATTPAEPTASKARVAVEKPAAKFRAEGSRSWTGMLSAAAGLLAIAAPATYMLLTWPSDSAPLVEPFTSATEAPDNPSSELAARPAAKNDRAVIVATPTAPEASDSTAPVAPAAFESDAHSGAPGRYGVAVGDRYAATAESTDEPAPFDPRADSAPLAEPAAQDSQPAASSDRVASFESPPADSALRPLDESTASATAEQSPLVGAPVYDDALLAEALAEAAPASRGFVGGDLSDPAQAPVMGQHYARLCYLAQVLTFHQPSAQSIDAQSTALESVDLLQRTLRTQGARDAASQVAGPWLAWTGRPHGGVVFVGVPSNARPAGSVSEYRFQVAGSEVVVVTKKPIDVDRFVAVNSRSVGIVGVVVESPRERIAGYTGDAERVVWARKTLALRDADEP
ncbi:MAG: MJ0042-type zinc finger domain-containing protein [Lacipirellulaceae bacterium]